MKKIICNFFKKKNADTIPVIKTVDRKYKPGDYVVVRIFVSLYDEEITDFYINAYSKVLIVERYIGSVNPYFVEINGKRIWIGDKEIVRLMTQDEIDLYLLNNDMEKYNL